MDHLGRSEELWEAMESCRADRGELADPQFAELSAALDDDPELRARFVCLQYADANIQMAFTQVPVPAGLAERIAARTAAIDRTAVPANLAAKALTPLACDTGSRRPTQVFRRRLSAGVAALAASAALLTAVWMHLHQAPALTPGRAVEEAMDFFGRDGEPPGQLVSVVVPPEDFPFSRDLRPLLSVRWRAVKSFLGSSGVAYDLPAVNGRATLYVIRQNVAGLSSYPPSVPSLSTGGNSAAVWQQGNLLYVLVVQGDAATYSEYLDRSSGPLT